MNKRTMNFGLAVLVLLITGQTAAPLRAQSAGSSPLSPASTGTTLAGIVECGRGYTSHELYDVKITLLEIIRGEQAWKQLQSASTANKPPDQSSEYILARIRFGYFARGAPGVCIHELKPDQFTAVSTDGSEYPASTAVPPKPSLSGNLHSGDTVEGWVTFLVSRQDRKPLMTYSADAGGAILHGGGKWFQLY